MASATVGTAFRAPQASVCFNKRNSDIDRSASPTSPRSPRSPTSRASQSSSALVSQEHEHVPSVRQKSSAPSTHRGDPSDSCSSSESAAARYRPCSPLTSSKCLSSFHNYTHLRRPSKRGIGDHRPHHPHSQQGTSLRFSPEPPTLLAFASSFQSLLDSQAPISSTHSAYSELLSVSASAFPPSTLPISALTDLINSNSTPSTSSSSKSSFSSVSTSLVDNSMVSGVGTETTAGLDLLGILAEEVDWDPQQRGAPRAAQLAILGQNLQSHHAAKQKLWAGQILGSLGLIEPGASRRNSFSTPNASEIPDPLPGEDAIQTRMTPGVSAHVEHKIKSTHLRRLAIADDPLNTMTLTKRTALFYENLYERLCPGIVPRAYIYPKLGRKSHDQDPTFAALALSISLLGMLGLSLPIPPPVRSDDGGMAVELQRPFVMPAVSQDRRSRAQESGELRMEATKLIERVLLLRLSAGGGGICFGQTPTLETVLTSFFLSIALYNLDDAEHGGGVPSFTEWKDASFFRFCEAVTLAKILGLDQIKSMAVTGDGAEELKMWWLLVRAERWWAQQKPGYVCQMEATSREECSPSRKRAKSEDAVLDSKQVKRAHTDELSSEPLGFLAKLGFAGVRDDLMRRFCELIDCLTNSCSPDSCQTLTSEAAVRIHDSLASLEHSSNVHVAADPILVDLACQTLRAILWNACLHHNLVSVHTQAPLRPDQPLHIALDTLDLLEDLDQLVLRSLPSGAELGDTIHETLLVIRDCVANLPNGSFAAEAFSFEQIDASDESDSPSNSGPSSPRTVDGSRANSTTITRAAQSVIDNLDRFLHRVVTH